ncbi:carbohydrate ABC transporter ATP-binding protein, CUT1 family [Anaerovirgula multivorans]|uniref:Carbohydrate ABC transporter ATP-binding protein, CUT1 family n=1 Tax=Anaerovirgula multivorans TaxID=312168 RepID=A0A239EIE0_9FIRM|nr:ABC transporter ATP-binding protein [Anaerovirgula multivorans]SNS44387.1 carbohydrate ABC transporter ATP-binding protein, CUT1 family [Anaerovirgula multivorans]
MANIYLQDITKKYENITVIKNLNLEIKDSSFTVLVGPSGCGKSTTLRMIAGLEKVNNGEIFIDGEEITHVNPGKRGVAMVFQNYALYPTMTVKENIEFGLKNNKISKEERESVIQEICDIVGLTEYLDRKPSNLSGGQRQRVALARAMVKRPKVFLMDEPLSNLDAKLRNQMRTELIQLHKKLGTTFVYVTHDQVEAMSMGDAIVVMDKGVIQHMANPVDLYNDPANIFTAQFIGAPPMNIIPGKKFFEESTYLGFRPEKVKLDSTSADNCLAMKGKILTREILGSETIYSIRTEVGDIKVKTIDSVFPEDIEIQLHIDYKHIYLFDVAGNRQRNLEKVKL